MIQAYDAGQSKNLGQKLELPSKKAPINISNSLLTIGSQA
jgi:hypothetical protein